MKLTDGSNGTNTTSESLSPYKCFHMDQNNFHIYGGSTVPYIINCSLNVVFSIVALVGNSLALRGIWKIPHSMSTPAMILLFNLAITDFAVGLIVQPIFVAALAFKIQGQHHTSLCVSVVIFIVASTCTGITSLLTITAISLDKYIALHLHLRYQELVTAKRAVLVLCVIWSVGVFLGASWFRYDKAFHENTVYFFVGLLILITSAAYFKVYKIACHHHSQIQAQLQLQARIQTRTETTHSPRNRKNGPAADRKSATTALLIYCVLLVCYLPYLLLEVTITYKGISPKLELLRENAFTVGLMNSSLNPFVYCWRVKEIRLVVYDTLRNIRRIYCKN